MSDVIESQMTRLEASLLLYLETVCVDYTGLYDNRRINDPERALMYQWAGAGYIEKGRVCSEDARNGRTLWVRLSPEAWEHARRLRRARAERHWKERKWRTTQEYRDDN